MTDPVAVRALLEAERRIAEMLLSARSGEDAFLRGMQALAEPVGWSSAALWIPGEPGRLRCVSDWAREGRTAPHRRGMAVAIGSGPVGMAWSRSRPAWVADVAAEEGVPGREALVAAGLGSLVAFALESAAGPVAIVEATFEGRREDDPELVATLLSVGRRVGQFVQHRRADRAVRRSEARKHAILDAALDVVITIDQDGRVVEANAALEHVFGWTPGDAVGHEMAALIVPPELRERHRRGLRALVAGGEPHLLGRRVELVGLCATGRRIPVELTITRIDVPGSPMFTGHIRDITERHEAEAELRASRARVVEAADAARRRIERDLHDGAQQGLVALALTLRLAESRIAQDPDGALELVREAREDLAVASAELRELARGIHPAVLTEAGLAAALAGLVRRSPVPIRADVRVEGRLPAPVEAAAYFAVAEALANAARHSGADEVLLEASVGDGVLRFSVSDDGRGGAALDAGSGLRGLVDRLAALDGELALDSPPGGPTVLRGIVPLRR